MVLRWQAATDGARRSLPLRRTEAGAGFAVPGDRIVDSRGPEKTATATRPVSATVRATEEAVPCRGRRRLRFGPRCRCRWFLDEKWWTLGTDPGCVGKEDSVLVGSP